MPRAFLPRFRDTLHRLGPAALVQRATVLGTEGRYELVYTPFEYVNATARLVIVGITPGNTQLHEAYAEVQRLLGTGTPDEDILAAVKPLATFSGPNMRPNLCRMLGHFGIHRLVGAPTPEAFWGSASGLLHATSVVPHAAFESGRMFNGSFDEVRRSPLLNASFELDFAASLRGIGEDARYVALGPTALAALRWCAAQGYLRGEQILGSLAHPSGNGGSQVPYYLREKARADLSPRDPVLHRCDWLDAAYADMRARMDTLLQGRPTPSESLGAQMPVTSRPSDGKRPQTPPQPSRKTPAAQSAPPASGLYCIVKRGRDVGLILRPHRHRDGCYVVSQTRFEKDYVRLPATDSLIPWLRQGFKLRMSSPDHPARPPSLIGIEAIEGLTNQ